MRSGRETNASTGRKGKREEEDEDSSRRDETIHLVPSLVDLSKWNHPRLNLDNIREGCQVCRYYLEGERSRILYTCVVGTHASSLNRRYRGPATLTVLERGLSSIYREKARPT